MAGYNDYEKETHETNQRQKQRFIDRKRLELSKNPGATVVVDGPLEWKEVAELDLVKLAADKERGKIKSFAHTQWGVKVEMYSADAAQTNILRLHGYFKEDNDLKAMKIKVTRK